MSGMRLTDFMTDIGRPVAYYPSIAKWLGGVKPAVLFCQLMYWSGVKHGDEFYKSLCELQDETGMTERELGHARKALVSRGVLVERYARLEHRLYFRLMPDVMNASWVGYIEGLRSNAGVVSRNDTTSDGEPVEMLFPETTKRRMGKTPNVGSFNEHQTTTETTAEITSERALATAVAPPAPPVPPTKPPEPKRKGPDLAPLVDAFRSIGLPDPTFVRGEAPAAQDLLRAYTPADIAECWKDFRAGTRGDQWERDRLSFMLLAQHNRIGNWQVWRDAGRPQQGANHAGYRPTGRTAIPETRRAPRPGERPPEQRERKSFIRSGADILRGGGSGANSTPSPAFT